MRKAKIPGEKMASRFHEFSNEDIARLLENAVPATTKKATNFGMNLLNGTYLKFSNNFLKNVVTFPYTSNSNTDKHYVTKQQHLYL